ncbi:hypothetical protein PHAVU_008G088901 [Phaseolus vulgaris]
MAKQVSVINSSYCAPHSIPLQINTEKGATYNENDDRLFYTKILFSHFTTVVSYMMMQKTPSSLYTIRLCPCMGDAKFSGVKALIHLNCYFGLRKSRNRQRSRLGLLN